MAITEFPPIESANEHGFLAVGGDLSPASLRLAYEQGIFPWPFTPEMPIPWFSPDPRGVIDFEELHVSRKLRKLVRRNVFEIRYNFDFESVIRHCARVPRKGQSDSWIVPQVQDAYINLFKREEAYSVEAWMEESLVGGVYGICINGIVTGESMFFTRSNAGKICLVALLDQLNQAGINWLDTQTVTPVVQSLGGKSIPRPLFLERLKQRKRISRQEIFPG